MDCRIFIHVSRYIRLCVSWLYFKCLHDLVPGSSILQILFLVISQFMGYNRDPISSYRLRVSAALEPLVDINDKRCKFSEISIEYELNGLNQFKVGLFLQLIVQVWCLLLRGSAEIWWSFLGEHATTLSPFINLKTSQNPRLS